MTTAALFGCTGLVGAQLLSTLLGAETITAVHTISRRQPKSESPKLNAIVDADSSQWVSKLSAISPPPAIVFSALGTTRAQAGGVAEQWKIDHDLNVELAKAARAAGVKTYLFVSSAGTRGFLSDRVPYSRMKIGVEDTVRDLGFDHAIILRPGLILGTREVAHTGGPLMNGAVRMLSGISQGLQDRFGQEAEVIARAAAHAAALAAEGKAPSKFWVVEQDDIVRLGRTEWKEWCAQAS